MMDFILFSLSLNAVLFVALSLASIIIAVRMIYLIITFILNMLGYTWIWDKDN